MTSATFSLLETTCMDAATPPTSARHHPKLPIGSSSAEQPYTSPQLVPNKYNVLITGHGHCGTSLIGLYYTYDYGMS